MPFSPQTVVASAARTTSGQSAAASPGGVVAPGRASRLALAVDVTAASGTTPTLDMSVEWSPDGATWFASEPADSFTQITAAKKVVKQFLAKAPLYRVVWVIAGTTPSFTFSVTECADSQG